MLEEAVAPNVRTQPVDERFYGRIAQVFAAIHRSQSSLAGAPAVDAVRLLARNHRNPNVSPGYSPGSDAWKIVDNPQCTDHEHHLNGFRHDNHALTRTAATPTSWALPIIFV